MISVILPETFLALRTTIIEDLATAGRLDAPQALSRSAAREGEAVFKDVGPISVLILNADEDARCPTLCVHDLVLAEGARNAGFGTALFNVLIAFCAHQGLDLALEAVPMADGGTQEYDAEMAGLVRFYERLGFENRFSCWDGNYVIRANRP